MEQNLARQHMKHGQWIKSIPISSPCCILKLLVRLLTIFSILKDFANLNAKFTNFTIPWFYHLCPKLPLYQSKNSIYITTCQHLFSSQCFLQRSELRKATVPSEQHYFVNLCYRLLWICQHFWDTTNPCLAPQISSPFSNFILHIHTHKLQSILHYGLPTF